MVMFQFLLLFWCSVLILCFRCSWKFGLCCRLVVSWWVIMLKFMLVFSGIQVVVIFCFGLWFFINSGVYCWICVGFLEYCMLQNSGFFISVCWCLCRQVMLLLFYIKFMCGVGLMKFDGWFRWLVLIWCDQNWCEILNCLVMFIVCLVLMLLLGSFGVQLSLVNVECLVLVLFQLFEFFSVMLLRCLQSWMFQFGCSFCRNVVRVMFMMLLLIRIMFIGLLLLVVGIECWVSGQYRKRVDVSSNSMNRLRVIFVIFFMGILEEGDVNRMLLLLGMFVKIGVIVVFWCGFQFFLVWIWCNVVFDGVILLVFVGKLNV